jgi:hypothetical protein
MKKTLLKSMLVAAMALGASGYASAQVYVNIRPVAPVVVQPPRPSPAHVWVGEEWREEGHGYKYAGGHWEAPPHPGARWVPGHWARDRRGEVWIRGHWA